MWFVICLIVIVIIVLAVIGSKKKEEPVTDASTRTSKEPITEVSTGTFTDERDGQTYRTVRIGGKTWMAENLNYKSEGSWCYDDIEDNGDKYGRLYDWESAKKASPVGWHLPTKQEWEALKLAVAGRSSFNNLVAHLLKAKSDWDGDGNVVGPTERTDAFGFSALPGGIRNPHGDFFLVKKTGAWWTATRSENQSGNVCWLGMQWDKAFASVIDEGVPADCGLSVRCVRDNN